MPSKQGQFQEQKGIQIQKYTPQQLLLANLVELPIAGLEERVKKELYENDALDEVAEASVASDAGSDFNASGDGFGDDGNDGEGANAANERSLDELYDSMDDGELPVFKGGYGEQREVAVSDSWSLIDDLTAQIGEYDLDEHQKSIVAYLIGSLNDNGFIDREPYSIVDELAFRMSIFTDENELLEMLKVLQKFDPPGIGARNLRECLLIQIDRKLESLTSGETGRRKRLELERRLISDYNISLVNNNLDKLHQKLGVTVAELNAAVEGIKSLNPRPGMSLSESHSEQSQTVIPDFIIETDSEGNISMTVNGGYVPSLKVDKGFLQDYDANLSRIDEMSQREREAFIYRKQKVESAQMFIEAVKQRTRTLYLTMKAIIDLQRDFFLTQDDAKLRPLVLRDVAKKTGLDESTVSRVKTSKYALVDGSAYSLEHFFLRTRANAAGVTVVAHQVEQVLAEIIASEDKSAPYSDEQLVERLAERGLSIKHRTVTKYRNQLGIPTAKLRRKE